MAKALFFEGSCVERMADFGLWILEFVARVTAMSEEPPKRNLMKTVYLPMIVATIFAIGIFVFVPQVGWFAAVSAWVGTVLFMSIWGSFYS